MIVGHHDFETRSALDLRKTGVYPYAEHPSTGVWIMSWCLHEEGTPALPVHRWRPGDPDPVPLLDPVARGGLMKVHNATFERTIWNRLIRARLCPHWPELRIEQQDCTMSRCSTLAIPISLEVAAKVLGANVEKDMAGNALMMRMARPRKIVPVNVADMLA